MKLNLILAGLVAVLGLVGIASAQDGYGYGMGGMMYGYYGTGPMIFGWLIGLLVVVVLVLLIVWLIKQIQKR